MEQATARQDSVNIVTEVPGPKSRELATARQQAARRRALARPPAVFVDHAHGATVTDVDGNTFIDWTGGVGCLNVGHTNAAVTAAITRRSRVHAHRLHDRAVRDVRRARASASTRASRSPARSRAALFNSGAEAVENAVKIARVADRPHGVICFDGRVPRPHADGDVADLASRTPTRPGFGPLRARGLPRAVPQPVRVRRRRRRSDRVRARRSCGEMFDDPLRGREHRRDHRRAGAGRGRLHRARRASSCRACASSATSTASCSSFDEVQSGHGPHRQALGDRALRRRARPARSAPSRSRRACRSRA